MENKVEVNELMRKEMRPDRDERGYFLPGHGVKSPGRPKRESELAMLNAITSTFTPDEVTKLLKDALDIAKEQKSARGMVAILEFIADRTLGKPTIRVEHGDTNAIDDAIDALTNG